MTRIALHSNVPFDRPAAAPWFPSAEERSDVSTRVQCRGQGATPSPAVSVAEPGDVHVDLYTSSVLMLAFIFREASSDFLPQGKLRTSSFTAGKQKFCFVLSFLCPLSRPLGGRARGVSLVKPVRDGADWHGARSADFDRLDVASGGRQHFSQFHPLVNTLTHTHTFTHSLLQCSVSLVVISQRTPSGLAPKALPEPKKVVQRRA